MERETRSRVPASTWAQIAVVAALFCLGRETLPPWFVDVVEMKISPVPARQPPREVPQRGPEIASVAAPTLPAARPERPRVQTRAGSPPHRTRPAKTAEESPRDPIVSRVWFGMGPPGEGTLPVKLTGPEIAYTGPALDHEVEGVMRVACVVTVQGEVDRCRVLQGVPFMDVAVLQALEHRRYVPARLPDGRPVETEYVFVVRLLLRGDLLID